MNRFNEDELLYYMNELLREKFESLKRRQFDYRYFRGINIAKRIYREVNRVGCEDLHNLCSRLIQEGIKRTHLDFYEISNALTEGEQKAEFILDLSEYGRGFIESKLAMQGNYSFH